MLPGIDHPDVGDAKLHVIVDSVLKSCHCVIGRDNLDTEVRRGGENLLVGQRCFGDDYVRDPNSSGFDLKSQLRERLQSWNGGVQAEPHGDLGLGITMSLFPHVPFDHLAIDKIAVRVIAGSQVLCKRDRRADADQCTSALFRPTHPITLNHNPVYGFRRVHRVKLIG